MSFLEKIRHPERLGRLSADAHFRFRHAGFDTPPQEIWFVAAFGLLCAPEHRVACCYCGKHLYADSPNAFDMFVFPLDCGHCLCSSCSVLLVGCGDACIRIPPCSRASPASAPCCCDTRAQPSRVLWGAGAVACGVPPWQHSRVSCANPPCLAIGNLCCTRCLLRYCSRGCQAAHYPSHKVLCRAAHAQARARLAVCCADVVRLASRCPCELCVKTNGAVKE